VGLDERAITSEIRRKAVEILGSGEPGAYGEVERLLGRKSQVRITGKVMARLLRITYYHLQYLLYRNDLRREEKRLRAARKEAAPMLGRVVTSQELEFSLWLPACWHVDSEDNSVIDLGEEAQSRYKEWLSFLEHRDFKKEYRSLRKELGDTIIPFEEFMRNENREIEFRNERWQEKLLVKMGQGFQVGYWSAISSEEEALPLVEVVKFHFREPMTSVEFYKAEKPEHDNLSSGNRPKQTFTVDGIEAIRFYCIWRGGDDAQFSTYMAHGLVGWAIDCWRKVEDHFSLRPLFQQVVSSFHRL